MPGAKDVAISLPSNHPLNSVLAAKIFSHRVHSMCFHGDREACVSTLFFLNFMEMLCWANYYPFEKNLINGSFLSLFSSAHLLMVRVGGKTLNGAGQINENSCCKPMFPGCIGPAISKYNHFCLTFLQPGNILVHIALQSQLPVMSNGGINYSPPDHIPAILV